MPGTNLVPRGEEVSGERQKFLIETVFLYWQTENYNT